MSYIKADQFELSFAGQAFNLAGEETTDGEARQREELERELKALEIAAEIRRAQRELLP